jgi:xanthine dehydrogenase accessory factor
MLSEQGHSAETIGRITCPIGLPGITGKDPAVIAVAVASALLQMLPGNEEAAVNGEKEEKGEWAFPGK